MNGHIPRRPGAILCVSLAFVFSVVFDSNIAVAQEIQPSAAGMVLQTMFSPQFTDPYKTMGLAQRNFLDLVESSKAKLEIALVIDGTDSMGDDLNGIRSTIDQMVKDLELAKGTDPSFQVVVFRDAGAPSGEVTFPLSVANHQFTSDLKILKPGLEKIQRETGAPYFPELVDLGIHAALTQLRWSQDKNTTRWLMVFSDAPPFDEGFDEAETKSRRRIATDQLVSLAKGKEIKINCVLCNSRPEEKESYDAVVDKTRKFMDTLATATEGLIIDLSYDDIRKALEQEAQKPRAETTEIGLITMDAIQQERDDAKKQQSVLDPNRRTRIAVLPHLPLSKMSFDPWVDEVRFAAEMRQKLRLIPGTEVKGSSIVERQFEALQEDDMGGAQLLQTLAAALDVDYVIWGKMSRRGDDNSLVNLDSRIIEATTGRQLAKTNVDARSHEATGKLIVRLASEVTRVADGAPRLKATFASVNQAQQPRIVTPVANENARDKVLTGFEALEQALAYSVGDPKADALLARAEAELTAAVDNEEDNPFAQLLLASCYLNQAQSRSSQGRKDAAAIKMQLFKAALGMANRARKNDQYRAFAELDTEIGADYAMYWKRDTQEAISKYETLTQVDEPDAARFHVALRAHWMLAGIYSGDWGVDPSLVNRDKARFHLTKILAHWGESSEAEYIRSQMRWDPLKGENRYEHLPKSHERVMSSLIES